jgi:hypothetical protein
VHVGEALAAGCLVPNDVPGGGTRKNASLHVDHVVSLQIPSWQRHSNRQGILHIKTMPVSYTLRSPLSILAAIFGRSRRRRAG